MHKTIFLTIFLVLTPTFFLFKCTSCLLIFRWPITIIYLLPYIKSTKEIERMGNNFEGEEFEIKVSILLFLKQASVFNVRALLSMRTKLVLSSKEVKREDRLILPCNPFPLPLSFLCTPTLLTEYTIPPPRSVLIQTSFFLLRVHR